MKTLKRYLSIWLLLARQELEFQLSSKLSSVLFFIGKMFRFITFFFVLMLLKSNTPTLAGYNFNEVVLFFLTFNFIDIVSQIFLRGVYSFAGKVRSGELDFYLAKPINTLFRSIAGSPDFNDLFIFFPLTGFSIWYLAQAGLFTNALFIAAYVALILNGLLISLAFHIFIVCLGVLTTEVDNAIMVYRDISQIGRFPMEIYREPFRWLLTFVVPVGIMVSVPARALLGHISVPIVLTSIFVSMTIFFVSLQTWKYALRHYTSASS